MMVSIYIHLWDTLAVNYMTLLLYSYIRPVFTKKIKRNHPETVESLCETTYAPSWICQIRLTDPE